MNVKGLWTGFYEYGDGYDLPQFGERVSIQVKIEGDEDGFEGICTEEASEHAIPEPSKISGFVDEGMVSFVKVYQNTYDHRR